MIWQVLHIFSGIVFFFVLITVSYLLFSSVCAQFRKKRIWTVSPKKKRIAVLITSYKEDDVIVNTVREAAAHDYPRNFFTVFVAADQLQPQTLARLRTLDANIIEVLFDRGSKAKSLNHLLNSIDGHHFDVALVLDGDNVMAPGFLEKINSAFQSGARAVQGHRTAKNMNTAVARLDALSEEINNSLFRTGQRALSLSAATIGSGMAFEFDKLKDVYNLPGIVDNPACDRVVDFEMMKAGIVVEYINDAILLDEKVSARNIYRNQRRRWLESQMVHLRLFFTRRVDHRDANFWNKLLLNLIPPRLLLLGLFGLVFLMFALQKITGWPIIYPSIYAWLLVLLLYLIALTIATPSAFFRFATVRSLLYVPVLLFGFLRAAFTMRVNRKDFVHTPKTFTGGESGPPAR